MKRKLIVLALILVGVVIVSVVLFTVTASAKLEKLADSQIADVDLTTIPDGNYVGSYTILPISVRVAVTISNQTITEIKLMRHFNGQGSRAEIIPARVVETQSLNVDIVSGATYSSKIILLAIRDALLHR